MSGWSKLVDSAADDPKLFGAHNERNKQPILDALNEFLQEEKVDAEAFDCLEIACGTGQHAAFFPTELKVASWTPTDFDPVCVNSTKCWTNDLKNVNEPQQLDASKPVSEWKCVNEKKFDLVYCANCIHIAPFAVCQGILAGAGSLLNDGKFLVFYGPFKVNGDFGADSNKQFDANLRERNAEFGIRDLENVEKQAAQNNLKLIKKIEMPANNYLVVFKKELKIEK